MAKPEGFSITSAAEVPYGFWPCACVYHKARVLIAIKMNAPSVAVCTKCGSERPAESPPQVLGAPFVDDTAPPTVVPGAHVGAGNEPWEYSEPEPVAQIGILRAAGFRCIGKWGRMTVIGLALTPEAAREAAEDEAAKWVHYFSSGKKIRHGGKP